MLKAIHAQEGRLTARAKAEEVVAKLKAMKVVKLAGWLEETVEETLAYYAFPDEHWRRIRTNSPLERIMREIRRRTRVAGAFPDGQRPSGRSLREPLNLAAARLRRIAGTTGSIKRYMSMNLLKERELVA